ncbi:MAG: gamma-glutamylcyclotransferase [Longimonas sp.]|uniref:gamma-glutamylcyclotransferase family protein n=1 Tax=Longimonas sp. TaxID=2039626 RepID=UPI00336403F0
MTNAPSHLMTYGSLMQATGMQQKLGVAPQLAFEAPCHVHGRLYDLGDFPGAVPVQEGAGDDEDATVQGELYRLRSTNVLTRIDQYEGYDPNRESASLFVRRPVIAKPMDIRAWIYWYNGSVDGVPVVESGQWPAGHQGAA